jgi:hypothetical protein
MVNNFLVSNFSLFSQRFQKKHKILSQILRGQRLISFKHFLKRKKAKLARTCEHPQAEKSQLGEKSREPIQVFRKE